MSLNLSDPAQLFAAKTQEYSRMFGLADTRMMPGCGLPQGGALAQVLKGLSQAFQGLADMIGGLGSMTGTAPFGAPVMRPVHGTGTLPALPFVTTSAADGAGMKPIAGTARIWGDPHFVGADGGQFDVQGEAGKTYNLLSDRGFQMNGRFDSWGSAGATVVGEVGISAGTNYINVEKSGKAVVNGQVLNDGDRVALRGGGYLDTVVPGLTGAFFEEPTPEAIGRVLDRFRADDWDEDAIKDHARGFSEERFVRRVRAAVADLAAQGSRPTTPRRTG